MKNYFALLLTVMLVSALLLVIAPGDENRRKYLRPLCAAVLMMTLLSPITSFCEVTGGKIIPYLEAAAGKTDYDGYAEYSADACAILALAGGEYGLKNVRVVFVTSKSGEDGTEEIKEIELFCESCPSYKAEKLISVIGGEYGCGVRIYTDE